MRDSKKRKKPLNDVDFSLDDYTDEECYKRYKNRCYRHLVFKSLLAFLFGILLAALARVFIG